MIRQAKTIATALALSGAVVCLHAAPLRLEDVLAPPPPPEQPKLPVAAEQPPAERLAKLLDPADASRPAAARLGELDELLVVVRADDPLHAHGRALRALLLCEVRRAADAETAAAGFLAELPDHPESRRVRSVLAWAAAARGRTAEALAAYRALAGEEAFGTLPDAVVWSGCELLVADGDGAAARRLLAAVDAPRLSAGGASLHAWWLLESLLVADDAAVDVPPAPNPAAPMRASIQVRRALVLQQRGKADEAAAIRKSLEADPKALAAAEAKALGVVAK